MISYLTVCGNYGNNLGLLYLPTILFLMLVFYFGADTAIYEF